MTRASGTDAASGSRPDDDQSAVRQLSGQPLFQASAVPTAMGITTAIIRKRRTQTSVRFMPRKMFRKLGRIKALSITAPGC